MKTRYSESCSWTVANDTLKKLSPPDKEDSVFGATMKAEDNVSVLERALRLAYRNGWLDGIKDLKEALEE